MPATYLTREFVDKNLTWISQLPEEWDLPNGSYYKLTLKMCQMSTLRYSFEWYDDRILQPKVSAAVDHPSKILSLDVSINDLIVLDFDALLPFRNLRVLDASINRLELTPGLECCASLEKLNLSHNFLSRIQGLDCCQGLMDLRLSQNSIINLRGLPRLTQLTILYLDHNQLESLQGIATLTSLKELYLHKNRLTSILQLTGCIQLKLLNASNNMIGDLRETSEVLRNLKHLDHLNLRNNPLTSISVYWETMVEAVNVTFLDGENIRPAVRPAQTNSLKSNINTIVGVAKRIQVDQIETERDKMHDDVRLLQRRILERQEEFKEFEAKMHKEMDSTVMHLDHLPETFPEIKILKRGGVAYVEQEPLPALVGIPIQDSGNKSRETQTRRKDYKNVKNTNELLRAAFNELCREQKQLNTLHDQQK